jgi:hypothetical protein
MIPSILSSKISTKPLPYLDAVKTGAIEEPIAGLVKALNIDGICGTRVSCAGHPFLGFRTIEVPCVVFVSDAHWAMAVSKILDEYIPLSVLNYYWTLSGHIVEGVGLSWDLSIRDSNTFFLSKSKLASDFKVLQSDIEKLAQKFQKRIVLGHVNVTQKQDNGNHDGYFETISVCDFSKGIGIFAFHAPWRGDV